MEFKLGTHLKHAWSAFTSRDPTPYKPSGSTYYRRPDRPRMSRGNERTIITSLFNRISIDVASVGIHHVQLDERDRFEKYRNSALEESLTVSANIDQTGRSFIQDVVISMLDEGVVAIVPTDSTNNPQITDAFDVGGMRTGKIVQWAPDAVRVRYYNELTGQPIERWILKRAVCIIENPLYAVVNEPNSTLQRLIRKLSILDAIDEQSGSGKLDLIIQVPYSTRGESRKNYAERRRSELEEQLSNSKYGVAYADSTEHIVQLNRSVENNLMKQIEYLTSQVYSQLGISQAILDGTANEQQMLNYNNQTIEPILSAIVDEMKRKFLSKTARSQGQTIMFIRDPFKLVPVNSIAELVDKFTRNEVMSSNEFRQVIGMVPSKDPAADELRNKNLSQSKESIEQKRPVTEDPIRDK